MTCNNSGGWQEGESERQVDLGTRGHETLCWSMFILLFYTYTTTTTPLVMS
jgi:hypothetical protein